MWRGLARRGNEKEKAAVPVPPPRPLRSRAAAAAAAGAGAAGEAGLGPGRAAPERRGRGARRRGPRRRLSSPSAPPPAGLGPDAAGAAEAGAAPSVSRARTRRARAPWGWGPGGSQGLSGAPAALGGGRPCLSAAASSPAIAAPLPGLPLASPRCRHRGSLFSPRRRCLAPCFLPLPFLVMGRLGTEEVRPGPPPRARELGPPRPCKPTRPAGGGAAASPEAGGTPGGTPARSRELVRRGCQTCGLTAPPARDPAFASSRFKSPGWGSKENRTPTPQLPSHPSSRGCFFLSFFFPLLTVTIERVDLFIHRPE